MNQRTTLHMRNIHVVNIQLVAQAYSDDKRILCGTTLPTEGSQKAAAVHSWRRSCSSKWHPTDLPQCLASTAYRGQQKVCPIYELFEHLPVTYYMATGIFLDFLAVGDVGSDCSVLTVGCAVRATP